MSLDCVGCRECGANGVTRSPPTLIQLDGCLTVCREKFCEVCKSLYTTVEIPIEVALDVFS